MGTAMKEKIIAAINEIRSDISYAELDEASIKSGIVQRFFAYLNWNPFNLNEVKPEYGVESKRVDFALRINELNKVFIEVKRPKEDLEPHQEQLLNYSFREGVKLAILTNGLTWWFYLPLNEGSWEQRRFYTADFLEQEPTSIAERFVDLLSKDKIASGDAIKNAESLYKSWKRKNVLKDAIPKVWHKIITDPDEKLVDLLIEATEKLSGFRPDSDDIEDFLKNVLTNREAMSNKVPQKKQIKDSKEKEKDPSRYNNKYNFFKQLLALCNQKTTLFSNISAVGYQNWVNAGAGKSGLAWTLIAMKKAARVEFFLCSPSSETNKNRFEILASRKKEIDKSFGEPLIWDYKDGRKQQYIRSLCPFGGLEDEERWPAIQNDMVNRLVRFEKALRPHIKILG
jgi:predicted type IV restriction endonuclease